MRRKTAISIAIALLIGIYVGSNGVSALVTLFDRTVGGIGHLLLYPPTPTIPTI